MTKMTRIKFDLDNLIHIMKEVLITKNQIYDLKTDQLKLNRKKDNFWREISFKFYGSDDYKHALRIYTLWTRNHCNLRNQVMDIVDQNIMDCDLTHHMMGTYFY
jgi:hypothetical protein